MTVTSADQQRHSIRDLFAYRTIDIVTVVTLGVAFGVAFWGWNAAYASLKTLAVFGFPPSTALLAGPWLLAGVVGGLVVRKPGAALICEFIAANVSFLLGNEWGASTLIAGALQGLGAELVFALVLYRLYVLPVAMLAGIVAATFETVYEWSAYYDYWTFNYKLAYLGFFALSGAILAGALGWVLTRALAGTGALDAFGPGREWYENNQV